MMEREVRVEGTAPKARAQLAVGLLCVSEPAGLTPGEIT